MKRKFIKNLAIVAFFMLISLIAKQGVYASNIEGTNTHKDYIFVLVHGLNSDGNIFTKYGLKEFLERPVDNGGLELKGRVFAYSFKEPAGDYMSKARELGDRNYSNLASGMDGKCWLEKARDDFATKCRILRQKLVALS